MSTPAARSLVSACLLLLVGLGAGWWLRGAVTPETGTVSEASNPPSPEARPAPEPARALDRWPQREKAILSGRPEADTEPAPQDSTENATPATDPEREMRALLDRQAFKAAMGLYQEQERRDARMAARLREQVIDALEQYLRTGDDFALTALAEAFLSVHYDDIDVLLLLARHQERSGYRVEAAQTFQLARSYSAAEPGRRHTVDRAFEQFVQRKDEQLAGESRWQELIGFYETLRQLDLEGTGETLRLGELHLRHGQPGEGRRLLRPLTSHPEAGTRAHALLDDHTTPSAPERRSRPPTGRIPLETVGGHFLLPLELNDASRVRLVIDTGASLTTLSRRRFEALSREIRFTELGPQLFNTANGRSRGMVYRVDSLRIGEHRLTDVPIAVLDFDPPDQVDGLLGMNVLSQFRFEVDQDEQVLLLQPRQ